MNRITHKSHHTRASRVLAVFLLLTLCFALLAVPSEAYNRTVRIGYYLIPGYYAATEDGAVSGYGASYNESVARYAGWKLFYIPYSDHDAAVRALAAKEIDMLAPVLYSEELEQDFAFSAFPLGTEYGALLTLEKRDDLIYEDYTSFAGLKIGYLPSDGFLDKFYEYEARNKFSATLVSYRNTAWLLTALKSGDVDAIILDLAEKPADLKLLGKFGATPYFYMLNKSSKDLLVELNDTLDSLHADHPELQYNLTELYYPVFVDTPLSKRELDFIERSETLKVACRLNSPPFSYIDEASGQMCGVDISIMDRIAQISGLKFEYVAAPEDSNLTDFAVQSNAAIIAGISFDRKTMLYNQGYTNSYLDSSFHFIGEKGMVFSSTKHLKVALTCEKAEELEYWRSKYPYFDFSRFATLTECVDALHSKQVDMLICDRFNLDSIMAQPKNAKLASLPCNVIPTLRRCEVTTNNDTNAEIIVSIINKSLRHISEQERESLVVAASGRYMLQVQKSIASAATMNQYKSMLGFTIALIVVLIVCGIFIFRYRRRTQNAIKMDEDKFLHIANNINGGVLTLVSNSSLEIAYCNNGFFVLLGCTPEEYTAAGATSFLTYVHPEDLHKLLAMTNSNTHDFAMDLRLRRFDGTYIPTLFNCTIEQHDEGDRGFYCVIMDMSEQNKLLERLRIENRRTELILERVEEVFFELNIRELVVTTSDSFISKFGWTMPE
ncbi:MAG: transporter substrate-binding domain-containing protein, partial [Ruminococcaceae bacterium]|nr:transporter substrate-binding domain-containing protein [Oscillospiraceae bacterium]